MPNANEFNLDDLFNGRAKDASSPFDFSSAKGPSQSNAQNPFGHSHDDSDDNICENCGIDHEKVGKEFEKRYGGKEEYLNKFLEKANELSAAISPEVEKALSSHVAQHGKPEGLVLLTALTKLTKELADQTLLTNKNPLTKLTIIARTAMLVKMLDEVMPDGDISELAVSIFAAIQFIGMKSVEISANQKIVDIAKDMGYKPTMGIKPSDEK